MSSWGSRLLEPVNTPELELAQVADSLNALALRRDRNGVVRVFAPNGSLRHMGRQWTLSPPISAATDKVFQLAEMISVTTLRQLLEFAYYVLSPWHTGSTLVWLLSENDPFGAG